MNSHVKVYDDGDDLVKIDNLHIGDWFRDNDGTLFLVVNTNSLGGYFVFSPEYRQRKFFDGNHRITPIPNITISTRG